MLRELLSILRASDPLRDIGENFGSMLELTLEMNIAMVTPRVSGSANGISE